jgi:hypothetical protein
MQGEFRFPAHGEALIARIGASLRDYRVPFECRPARHGAVFVAPIRFRPEALAAINEAHEAPRSLSDEAKP